MFLKYRYRLGFEALCREVTDSISWQRFVRIPLGSSVPHPTTLMKITTRCGSGAVDGLNEALLAKAVAAKVLKTNRVRVDATVVEADVAYPTDSGLLAKGVAKMATTIGKVKAAGLATRTTTVDRTRSVRSRARGGRGVGGTAGRVERIAAQTRQRIAGTTPDGATRLVSLHDPDACPIAKAGWASLWSLATRRRSWTTRTASVCPWSVN